MLANLKIICKFHAFLGRDISGTTFLGPNLVSFNQTLVILWPPYCTRVSKDTGSSSCERKIFRPSVYFFSLDISNISNMKQAPPEKLAKPVSIMTTRQFPLHQAQREWSSSYDWTGCSSIPFISSQVFSKSGNPDVLKLFHRHSVWMIRISVLVKVNGIRHYSFIDLILPCFSHKQIASRA